MYDDDFKNSKQDEFKTKDTEHRKKIILLKE